MNTRIRELRQHPKIKLTLEQFGKRLGVTKAAISKIENNERGVTEQMILSICREFNVNEDWLRTGNGSMFVEVPEEDMYSRAAASLLKTDDALAIEGLKLYYNLRPEEKEAVANYILQLADMIREHRKQNE